MLRLVSDANFNEDVVTAMRDLQKASNLVEPAIELVGVRDVGLGDVLDPVILAWAAANGRIVLTHDKNTMPDFAYERVRLGLPMPGVFEIVNQKAVGPVAEKIFELARTTEQGKWANQVVFLRVKGGK